MTFSFFHEYFPEIAKEETRSFSVLSGSDLDLPPADYSLFEMYCDQDQCDCRRVFLYVVSSIDNDVKAIISWGWESKRFYVKWLGESDPKMIRSIQGPILNEMSPQSELAPAILKFVKNVVLKNSNYTENIKRHYKMFRYKINNKIVRFGAQYNKKNRRK